MDFLAASAGVGAGLVFLLQRAIRNNNQLPNRRVEDMNGRDVEEEPMDIGDALPRNEGGLDEVVQDEGVFDADFDEDDEENYRTPSEGEGDYPMGLVTLRAVPVPYVRVIPLNIAEDDDARNNRTDAAMVDLDDDRRPPKKRNLFTQTNPDYIIFYPL